MGTVETSERIRNASFKSARRGYDRSEVDAYLAKLAESMEGRGHSDTIKQELERIGRQTAKVLTAAEEAAQSLRADAEQKARKITEDAQGSVKSIKTSADEYAKKVRQEAQAFATKTRTEAEAHSTKLRSEAERILGRARKEAEEQATKVRDEADGYAKRVREEADVHAAKTIKAGEDKAIGIVDEGVTRRREMEKVIADLEKRRDAVVGGLEQLSNQLAGAVTGGRDPITNNSRPLDTQPAARPAKSTPPPSTPPPSPSRQ
jgi:DivIVA domain-containing protein